MKPKFVYNNSNSSDCPVQIRGKYINILFRDGMVLSGQLKAERYSWEKKGVPSDIIAYQLIEGKS